MTRNSPTLVMLIGAPAVGKMTVGHELATRTGLRLFHNHHTVFAELETSQAERRRRNETPFRLAEKPSKRDLAASIPLISRRPRRRSGFRRTSDWQW
jgi:shikimate kinase